MFHVSKMDCLGYQDTVLSSVFNNQANALLSFCNVSWDIFSAVLQGDGTQHINWPVITKCSKQDTDSSKVFRPQLALLFLFYELGNVLQVSIDYFGHIERLYMQVNTSNLTLSELDCCSKTLRYSKQVKTNAQNYF